MRWISTHWNKLELFFAWLMFNYMSKNYFVWIIFLVYSLTYSILGVTQKVRKWRIVWSRVFRSTCFPVTVPNLLDKYFYRRKLLGNEEFPPCWTIYFTYDQNESFHVPVYQKSWVLFWWNWMWGDTHNYIWMFWI